MAAAIAAPAALPNPAGARHWRARASEEPEAVPERASRDLGNPYLWMAIAVTGGAVIGTVLGLVR